MGTNEYIGLTLDGNLLKVARIKKDKKRWKLTHLERIAVKEETKVDQGERQSEKLVRDYSEGFHFGLDESYGASPGTQNGDLDLLMAVEQEGDSPDVFNSNVTTLRDTLEGLSQKKVQLGMTIQTGDTNFQVLKDKDYSQLKSKELEKLIKEHLQKVYNTVPNADHYKHLVREDGSLLLASYEDKPYLLKLLDRTQRISDSKIKVKQMMSDEGLLAKLAKKNYEFKEEEVTCVIHMGFNRSRLFFMKGDKIQYALAPIDEGRGSSSVLDVVFSKILFQLDTGELSGLDRILITNNDLNGTSIDYFQKQFPDLIVEEFHFKSDCIDIPEHLDGVAVFFTSAIGAALSAAEVKDADFNDYSMLPEYIRERQNVLKLRWHGIMLLILLLATPVAWNYMYQQKQKQINDMNEELFRTELSIVDLEQVVAESNTIQDMMATEQVKLDLLNRLGDGAFYWSETLKTLNDGLDSINGVWIDRINPANDGFTIQGYSTTRSSIPQVTNLFGAADLKAVSVVDMRNVKVYKFSIKVFNNLSKSLDAVATGSP